MREYQCGNEKNVEVKQLTVSDQQLIAEYHLLTEENQKLVQAYMRGLIKMASRLESE